MIKKIIKSLMAFILVITIFAGCNATELIDGLLDSYYGDYPNNNLPPEGSPSIRNYSAEYDHHKNVYAYNFDKLFNPVSGILNKVMLKNFNFTTENKITHNYDSIVYKSTFDTILLGGVRTEVSWNENTITNVPYGEPISSVDSISHVTEYVDDYYVLLYSNGSQYNNWDNITKHIIANTDSPGTGHLNITSRNFTIDKPYIQSKYMFVAVIATFDEELLGDTETDRRDRLHNIASEVNRNQSLLENGDYLKENGIAGVAIRFYEIYNDNRGIASSVYY